MNYIIINIKPSEERKQTLSTGYYKKCLLDAHDYVKCFQQFS